MIEAETHKPGKLQGKVTWRSPSNIAIVKYWGKKGHQLPLNPSLSMTLSRSFTQTTVSYSPSSSKGDISFGFSFEGNSQGEFSEKIGRFLNVLNEHFPFLKEFHLDIESSNSFPHSAGIASSASAMSALALCILSISETINNKKLTEEEFFRNASFYARLGSGSACRSVYPKWALWGDTHHIKEASDKYAIDFHDKVHPAFHNLQDTILIVHSGPKPVSSSTGHELMNKHPFLEQRIEQANQNIQGLTKALKVGNMKTFMEITENEAYSLHALMKSSEPGFILTRPNTLEIIRKLQLFREKTDTNICFTLDAGPNVHLIYPFEEKQKVIKWITDEILDLCENRQWIDDAIGDGPKMLTQIRYDN